MRRPHRRHVTAVLTGLLALVSAAQVGVAQQPVTGTSPTPAGPSQLAAAGLRLGVASADSAGYPALRAGGVRFVKILADWSAIEPQPGQRSWADLDPRIAAAVREGLTPVVVLAHTPRWASIGTGSDLARPEVYTRQPPRDVRDWERFVTAVAERHRGRVFDWQVWTQLGLPAFRGTGSEYLALLRAAKGRLSAVDSRARVAMTTPTGVDLGFVLRVAQEAPGAFDAVALAPQGFLPESLLRPLSVLAHRLRPLGKAVWLDWALEQGVPEDRAAGAWVRLFGVAQAAGVERIFVTDPRQVGAGSRQAAAAALGQPFAGYLVRDPDVFAVVLGAGAEAVLLAWTVVDGRTLEVPGGARVTALDGQPVAAETREGRAVVRLSLAPVTVAALPSALVDEARATVTLRGPLVPVVGPDRDFSRAAEVFTRLGRQGEERGLYNLPFRSRRNGAVEPVELGGVEAVQVSAARQVIYVYFDIDDTFVYFSESRTPIDVVVEVWGARAAQQVGFNLLYDSAGGYRFTPWQWVGVREGWVTHTIRLTDAVMANTWGWDFAINTAGNRADDLAVRSVTVRKVRQ